ncbi:hypothetical protein OH77DRAFT_193670 [Trametes cingulata]|nr:hypothetical protein OH77DRAFT_193670 [Trametes cingulata]
MLPPRPYRVFTFEGRLYTVINYSPVEWLPGIPLADPERNLDLRDLRKALWAVNRAPEMAYMLRRSHADGQFFARLSINSRDLPIAEKDGAWFVLSDVRERWKSLENSLLHISNVLLERTRNLPEAKFPCDPHWPLPREMGYLQNHRSLDAAKRALWKSRDALFLLVARCSLAIALAGMLPRQGVNAPPAWLRILIDAGVTPTWIDELGQSLIADLSPGLRVGAFINPLRGPGFTEWVNHVPCMISANLPVYVYWPCPKDADYQAVWDEVTREFPFLGPYRPNSTSAPTVQVSDDEHISRDRFGRWLVVNAQNSFRWEDVLRQAPLRSVDPAEASASELSIPHGPGQRPSFPSPTECWSAISGLSSFGRRTQMKLSITILGTTSGTSVVSGRKTTGTS